MNGGMNENGCPFRAAELSLSSFITSSVNLFLRLEAPWSLAAPLHCIYSDRDCNSNSNWNRWKFTFTLKNGSSQLPSAETPALGRSNESSAECESNTITLGSLWPIRGHNNRPISNRISNDHHHDFCPLLIVVLNNNNECAQAIALPKRERSQAWLLARNQRSRARQNSIIEPAANQIDSAFPVSGRL